MHGKSHNNTEPLSTTATQVASDASYHGSANSSSGSSNYGSTVEHGVTSYGAADVCPCCAGVFHQGLPPAYHNPDHKPILAERFKTKMCRNYEQTGVCPYVHRCMFAHGEHELRTKHMNLADGLVTEEAIKNFKRANYEASFLHHSAANPHHHQTSASCVPQPLLISPVMMPSPDPTHSDQSELGFRTPKESDSFYGARASFETPSETAVRPLARGRSFPYVHDPYHATPRAVQPGLRLC